uniref:Uncharacterized protein n=1 Tax=Physcomitrium patens TaxID=3218 RepID=A0A7I4ETY4_PHYPA
SPTLFIIPCLLLYPRGAAHLFLVLLNIFFARWISAQLAFYRLRYSVLYSYTLLLDFSFVRYCLLRVILGLSYPQGFCA